MAYLWCNQNLIVIEIPTTEEVANVTYYVILVNVGEIKWKVRRRYTDFLNLHNKLVTDHGVSKDILPSKKVIGNKCDVFIESRRKALEAYLQNILIFLKRTMPQVFVKFLEFHVYDIYFILQDLSLKCFAEADFILSSSRTYSFTPLELHALSEFLKKPVPDADNSENPLDLGPILDMCYQLDNLTICGSQNEYLHSNIVFNKLPFELSSFKIHKSLHLKNISLDMIYSFGNLRNTVTLLKVGYTSATNISDVLQCDVLHKNSLEGSELHALSEFLKKPVPDADNSENPLDLGPILDMCYQLDNLTICGSQNEYLHSNIVFNKLPFELSSFKIHKSLHLKNISLDMIYSFGNLRNTVTLLKVGYTSATNISDVLQCDVLHKNSLEGSERWVALEILNLSNNNIVEIDKTISLAKNLKSLILNGNKISTISNLTNLPKLEFLSIVNNLITICDQLHTRVGNIKALNLSQNNIVTTKGFYKLYSLENLDLSCNKITEVEEIEYLGKLPCLENLTLTGNNVSTTVDYRMRVLELFADRAKDICLDNEKPSQSELDKVSVLGALRMVKQGKTPNLVVEKTNNTVLKL